MLGSKDLLTEIKFTTSRSSGPGGQNVNKVNSRVKLFFNVLNSKILSDTMKVSILQLKSSSITSSGEVQISSQSSRSQLKNKELALEKFDLLLEKAFQVKKKRKPTKPSKAAEEKRLKQKKMLKEKKDRRRLD